MSDSASIKPESKPAIIIPCHNRKAITMECLARLEDGITDSRFRIVLVDDGSTDGTSQTVAKRFPKVQILRGNGSLFWTGAVELGMRTAYAAGATSFIWINDDTEVAAGAIEAITSRAEEIGGIVSGLGQVIIESQNYEWYFPALYRRSTRLETGEVDRREKEVAVDSCRGNLVAVSRPVVDRIGFPDGKWIPHFGGDSDYGLRASKAGLPVRILTGALVRETALVRSDNQSWLLGEVGVFRLWRAVFQKRNALYPPMVLVYNCRHWGVRGLVKTLLVYLKLMGISLLRLVLPRGLRIRLFGRYSHAWQALEPMRNDAAV